MNEVELTEADAEIDASMLESMTQEEWDEMTSLMIKEAPRRFVILQELGIRADGHVAAWGLAFDDGLDMIDAENGAHYRSKKFDNALRMYRRLPYVTTTVVWIDPAPEPDQEDAATETEGAN